MQYMKVKYTKSGEIFNDKADALLGYQELDDKMTSVIRVTDLEGNTLDEDTLNKMGWTESKIIDVKPEAPEWSSL